MNPHKAYSTSPLALLSKLWNQRYLIAQMARREVVVRYKGSLVGLGWSFFNPVLMLAVYTFVFSVVFKARWGIGDDNTSFAIVLFVGLIVHGLFSEVINRAPGLIGSNVNYVKKVIFPLEILPVVTMGAALFHAFISVLVLLCGFVVLNGYIHWTAILLPVVISPFLLMTLGFAWMIASMGVYLRDVGQFVGQVTTVMLFLSPVLYPISMLPERFHVFLMINPLTFVIEQARIILLLGHLPDWRGLAIYTMVSALVAWLGYFWFQKTRRGFGDVL